MTLNRWDPFKDLLNFQDRMHRIVSSTCAEGDFKQSSCWCPAVDIIETPEAFIFQAELPGVGRENIEIEVEGARLKITGQRSAKSKERTSRFHSCERSYGFFERTFQLPRIINVEDSEAKYQDGVLEIILPKATEEREGSIKVVCLR